MTLEMGNEMK